MIVEKLRDAYFQNTTNVDEIKTENIAVLSDLYMVDSVLKSVVLQTNANSNGMNESQHRNTFLYR